METMKSLFARFTEQLKSFLASSRFLVQFAAGLHFFWVRVLGPIQRTLFSGLFAVLRWYRRLWDRSVYDKHGGLVYRRAGVMVTLTIVGIIVAKTLVVLTFQTVFYFTTYNDEQVYLIQSEEIFPDDNIWAVRGCDTKRCDWSTSIYYRIRPTLFNHLWSIVHNGNLFLPDVIGSSVPTGMTECRVVSYGIRVKSLMKYWEIYPDGLSIECDAK